MRSSEAMELLGLPPYSRPSPSEVKTAYRKMVMESHPDRFPEHLKSQAESKFKEIAEAYSCLKDGIRGSRMEVHVMRSGVPTGYGGSNKTLVKAPFLLIMFAAVSFGAFTASRISTTKEIMLLSEPLSAIEEYIVPCPYGPYS